MKKIYVLIIAAIMMLMFQTKDVKAIVAVDQTDMQAGSATVSWQKQSDEVYFRMYIWMPESEWKGTKLITTYTNKCLGDTASTTYTFTGLEAGQTYEYIVWALDADKDPLREIKGTIKTAPAQVKDLKLMLKWSSFYELGTKKTMEYNLYVDIIAQNSADGYEIILYDNKGKQVKKVNAKANESSIRRYVFKDLKQNFYRVKARSYNTFKGKKYYGAWSTKDYALRQPASAAKFSGKTLYIKWEKIKNVSGYDIYLNDEKKGEFTKVKSVGKNKTMISVKKLRGKSFKKGQTYYYYVVAKKKAGKTTFKSVLSRKFKVKKFR